MTDHIRTLGLAIGIPALGLAIWWGRKLGSLGTEKAYYQLHQPTSQSQIQSQSQSQSQHHNPETPIESLTTAATQDSTASDPSLA